MAGQQQSAQSRDEFLANYRQQMQLNEEHRTAISNITSHANVGTQVAEAALTLHTSLNDDVKEARAIEAARVALNPPAIQGWIPDWLHTPDTNYYCGQGREAVRHLGLAFTEADITAVLNAAAPLLPDTNTPPTSCPAR